MRFWDRINLAFQIVRRADDLIGLVEKAERLGSVLDRLQSLERVLSANDTLASLADRIAHLNEVVEKVETLAAQKIQPEPKSNGAQVHPVKQDLIEWNRLKLLSKFIDLAGKGEEIEKEWQRIQQEEFDQHFAFQTYQTPESESKYLFQKGIAEGVRWCVKRFT